MPDLRELLEDAAQVPTSAPDADTLWAAGRQRRTRRHVAVGVGGAALAVMLVVGVGALAPGDQLVVEPVQPPPSGVPSATEPAPAPRSPSSMPTPTGSEPAATVDASPETVTFTTAIASPGPALGVPYVARHPFGAPPLLRYDADGNAEALTPPGDWVVEGQIALDATGNLGVTLYQESSGRSIVVLVPADSAEGRVLVAEDAAGGQQRHVVGAGELDGPVILVAEGRATSVADDEGTDLVAYREDGTSEVLVEHAASSWEGGLGRATVRDGWIGWHAMASVKHTVLAMPVGGTEPAIAVTLEPEGGADPLPADLLLRTTGGGPVLQVLMRYPSGYPDPVVGSLWTYRLPDGGAARYELDGFGWDTGLPYSLSVLGSELVIGRIGEGGEPLPAWIGGVGRHGDLAVRGEVRVAG